MCLICATQYSTSVPFWLRRHSTTPRERTNLVKTQMRLINIDTKTPYTFSNMVDVKTLSEKKLFMIFS